MKRSLLMAEGVAFRGLRVDLDQHQWKPRRP